MIYMSTYSTQLRPIKELSANIFDPLQCTVPIKRSKTSNHNILHQWPVQIPVLLEYFYKIVQRISQLNFLFFQDSEQKFHLKN